jgi:2-haloacid dehalogenase
VIRGLLLDFYGTVVEDDDAIMADIAAQVAEGASVPATAVTVGAAWSREFEAVAEGFPFRTLRDSALQSLATVMESVGCQGDPAELCAPQFAYWRAPPLRTGTLAFLSQVKVPICIVSDADHDDLGAAISLHGLTFDAVVASSEIGAYKPAAAMFTAALKALNLPPHETIHIGDSLRTDIAGAHSAGIPTAWVNRRNRPEAEGALAAHIVPDLAALIPRLLPQLTAEMGAGPRVTPTE